MLRQEPYHSDGKYDELLEPDQPPQSRAEGFDIQQGLNRLEEMILESPRIMFTRRTVVDEEQLLAQLDLVRLNLPAAFGEALEIVRYKEDILLQAEEYAQEIIEAAQRRAAQILDESGIVQQAEMEANHLQQQVQQDCEDMKRQTLNQVEQTRRQALQELEQIRQATLAECEDIQRGADEYADSVLTNIEQGLIDMLKVVRNGRQQLYDEPKSSSQRPPK